MILELIILALFLNSAHAAALNKRGFALGSYNPNTRLTNGPATGLSRSVWSDQLNQRYKKHDKQRPKTALSYAYDQFASQNNEDILRSLSTLDRKSYPMVVQIGETSRQFLIVDCLDTNPLFNAYEAYVIHDKFVSSTPLVLKAFRKENGKADQNLSKELNVRAEMKEKNVVVDRAHYIIVYGGTYVFEDKQAKYTSKSILRNDIGYLDNSEKENAELENLVNSMIRIIMLGDHFRMRVLDDDAALILFNRFVKKLEKKEYKECQEMIKMIDPGIIEKWNEIFHRNQQIFWQ